MRMLTQIILFSILLLCSSQQQSQPALRSVQEQLVDNPSHEEFRHEINVKEEEPSKAATSLQKRQPDTKNNPHIWLDKRNVSFGESLTLYFKNVGNKDVIALYCPADEPDPENYREAETIRNLRARSRKQGLGSQDQWHISLFPIVREESCEFRYWKRYFMQKTLRVIAHAPFVVRDADIDPRGIHVSQTVSPTSIRIHFATGKTGIPVVNYGERTDRDEPTVQDESADEDEPTALDMFEEGMSRTYTANDMCHLPDRFASPKVLHTVLLHLLTPDTQYTYRVGIFLKDKNDIFWSEEHSFTTSPPIGAFPVSVLVCSDRGCPYANQNISPESDEGGRSIDVKNNIRAIHHMGELTYAGEGAVRDDWEDWLDRIRPFAARVPMMIIVGNRDTSAAIAGHSSDWQQFRRDSFGEECEVVPISARFDGSGYGNNVFWYAYDLGGVHFIMLSSEHDLRRNSRQHQWLQHALTKVDRMKTPWLVIEMYHPLYHSLDDPEQSKAHVHLQESEVEDLFHEYGVDVILSGRDRSYFRSCNGLYRGKCRNGGPVHITVGTTAEADINTYDVREEDWTEKVLFKWGYGRLTATDENTLHWEFVKDDHYKVVMDELWIRK